MVECSLCYFMNFIFRLIYNALVSALEYPIFVFLCCFLLALAIVSNFHAAKLICDLSTSAARSCRSLGNITVDYGLHRGPHTWQYSGENQSPINILDANTRKLAIRELLTWNHYDDLPYSIIMENTGHTAKFSGNIPTLSGADLLASYTFIEICFRWSLFNNEGSEHMLNYQKFPLELQAMHRTGPTNDCVSSYDLLMVAYFFEISRHNPYLDPIIQNLHRIQNYGTKIEIPPFPLSYLCHQFRSGFYSYGGSITEPPCYQGAEWFVFPEPLAISERQLNEFRKILSGNGRTLIIRNARPVQNINSERVINFNEYNPLDMNCMSKSSVNTVASEEYVLD